MGRFRPHFKSYISMRTHPKTAAMYGDNDLLATYTRIGHLMVERFAGRRGDMMVVHVRELLSLTDRPRMDSALNLLRRLAEVSPLEAFFWEEIEKSGKRVRGKLGNSLLEVSNKWSDYQPTLIALYLPNFAKKQFNLPNNGSIMEPSDSDIRVPSKRNTKEKNRTDQAAAQRAPRKDRKTTQKNVALRAPCAEESEALLPGMEGQKKAASSPEGAAASSPEGAAAAWPVIRQAFGAYGQHQPETLSRARRVLIEARLKEYRERGVDALAAAVHGYVAAHGLEPRGGDWDPRKNFEPETIFRPSKTEKYILAHDRAVKQGRQPPFATASGGHHRQRALRVAQSIEEQLSNARRQLHTEDPADDHEGTSSAPGDPASALRRLSPQ